MADYQVIARKYRPWSFDEVVGQEAVARTLKNAIASGRVAHAYMFCGPRGVGKTSMARILARALNCLSSDGPTPDPCRTCALCVAAAAGDDLDVFEMDAASNRKVDDARNLIANVSFHPARARFKVYVVDEVHMLTTEAFNALLKTLEEPPPHVKFVFATTDPQKVPATILSRCQRFDFRPVPANDIASLLERIAAAEGLTVEEGALAAIARAATGGVRDAESLLEQLATLGDGAVRVADLHALLGTVSGERMRSLFDAVSRGEVAETLRVAAEILDAGTDPGELLRQCMRHAHDLLLVRVQGPRAAGLLAGAEVRDAIAQQAERFSDATLAYAVTTFSESLKNARLLGEGRLFAETALARLAGHGEMRYLDQLTRKLAALEQRLGPGGPGAPPPQAAAPAHRPPQDRPPQRRPAPGGSSSEAAPVRRPPPSEPEPPPAPAPAADGEAPPGEPALAAGAAQTADVAADLAGVRERWQDVREAARGASSRLMAALQPARVEAVRGGVLELSFPPSAGYHRAALDDPGLANALGDALEAVLGTRHAFETVTREEDAAAEPSSEPGSRPRERGGERLSATEVEAVRQSPLTKLVEDELGGRIVQMKRKQ